MSGPATASPLVEAFYSTVTQALCVGAVVKGCDYSLRRWLAVSTLTPPEVALHPSEPPKNAKWKLRAIGLSIFAFFMAFEGGLIFGAQRIKSEFWLNALWAGIEGLLITLVLFTSSLIFFPARIELSYIANKLDPGAIVLKEKREDTVWPRIFGAAGVSALCIYLSSQNIRALQPVVVAAWVLMCLATANMPKMNVKWANIVLMGYITVVPVIGIVLGGLITLVLGFFGENGETAAPSEPKPELYGWLGRVMIMVMSGLPCMMAGVLISLALRFDHAQTRSFIALRGEPGQAAIIPTSSPDFAKPMFRASVAALTASLVVAEVLTSIFEPTHSVEMAWIFMTIPTVCAVQLITAKRMGTLKDWWKYEEIWIPSKEDVAKIAQDIEAVAPVEEKPAQK
ncbi:hypothetical protein BD324DRAFT_649555 [Kockovaella imperatae]|uniref:Uncharacterized protein n=1 Tax=Kockovaella imperatae TaxID=4999 RepID=A0A1Y1UL02_9TREE|nr:hypothetical protein BD324DRAFT_649555 [Kockovaella imperatae]ORX38174.1 hypothetical protein BD324DRAFT_649555 [Kockovaella imperatae]